jgi:hypothetical protein
MRLALTLFATLAIVTTRPLAADDTPKASSPSKKSDFVRSAPNAEDSREVRVITLRHARVETAVEMLKQLGYEGGFVPDSRTNSLIVHDSSGNLAKLTELIKVIDQPAEMGAIPHPVSRIPSEDPADQTRRVRAVRTPLGRLNVVVPREHASPSEAAPQDVRKLRQTFRDLEAQAAQTAAELRNQLRPGSGPEKDRVVNLQQKLRDQVAAAYDARIQMQQAEVNWLRQRLVRIERQLEDRGRLKGQVIDRRIEDLLNPAIQWDPNLAAANDRAAVPETRPEGELGQLEKEVANRNNLKQLALAMHNFHDTYSHFPKAVSTARDAGRHSDTPHSWRIDLLPFLGAADLYRQYKMDEPWDGPNNKKLLDRMPAIFRSPYDEPKSMSTAYAVLVGKGTVFEPGREGIKISEITDGTSNTILVVEARRNCPWMKPDDIPFDADKPAPELGGFVENKFAAVMADGRACLFERSKVEEILNLMIRRNDGHPIKIPFE